MTDEKITIYPLKINSELWRKFKSKCSADGFSMIEKLKELIINYVSG